MKAGTALAVLTCVVLAGAGAATGVEAFHRAGQTFITWPEVEKLPGGAKLTWGVARQILAKSKITYRIYAHDRPITAANRAGAKQIGEVGPLSGYNLNGRNVEYLIAQAMIKTDEVGELARNYNGFVYRWHMDDPRMNRYPLKRFVIDEKAGPLPPGTGLFVAHPKKAGVRYYAVVARDGKETAISALAKPVTETVGTGEPVCQGDGLRGPYFDYPGRRKVYVQWCGPPVAPKPMYFNWSVLVPPDCAKRAPVELYFHSGNYSYARPSLKLMRRSIQIAPHDWPFSGWHGYRDAKGTVGNHTQRRMVAFLEWAKKKLPVDPDRIIAVGGDGAAMLALSYPDMFAYVIVTGFGSGVLNPKAAKKYAAVWGPKSAENKDDAGRGNWEWAELDKVLLARQGVDLPLFVCRGRSWGGVKGWGKGRGRFYTAMKKARQPLFAHWAWGGRMFPPDKFTSLWRGLDITRKTPVPAFANSSADAEGEGRGQTNSIYAWRDIKDAPDAFEITITGGASTFDLTLRRVQNFRPKPGETLEWGVVYPPLPRVEAPKPVSGTVTVDKFGLITLKQLKLARRSGAMRLKMTRAK